MLSFPPSVMPLQQSSPVDLLHANWFLGFSVAWLSGAPGNVCTDFSNPASSQEEEEEEEDESLSVAAQDCDALVTSL
ncbi:unnamed protein product [Sphagnum balticum]